MNKAVFICAPLGGNVKENLEKVRHYAEYALKCGDTPIVPHYFAEILDDNDPEQRKIGISSSKSLIWKCDECWVFGDVLTEGMKIELQFIKPLNVKVRYFTDGNGGTIREKNKKS